MNNPDNKQASEREQQPLRMNAYYYEFTPTGNEEIDLVLSAVACAGKAYHDTSEWGDECGFSYHPHKGATPIDWIQNAANKAANSQSELEKLNQELAAVLKKVLHVGLDEGQSVSEEKKAGKVWDEINQVLALYNNLQTKEVLDAKS